jgi:anti-sigma B factor antagonist
LDAGGSLVRRWAVPPPGSGAEHEPPGLVEVRVIGSPAQGLAVAGELDMAEAEAFERLAGEAAAASGPEPFVLDLRGLTFVDSFGVRALFNVAARARDAQRTIRVIVGGSPIRRVLEFFAASEALGQLE